MDIFTAIYMIMVTWYAIDTKIDLEKEKKKPPVVIEKVVTKEVKIPVTMECPKPPEIQKPVYAIEFLTAEDSDNYDKSANSYVKTVGQCFSYSKQQEEILNGYR